jgi:hypothetical protein
LEAAGELVNKVKDWLGGLFKGAWDAFTGWLSEDTDTASTRDVNEAIDSAMEPPPRQQRERSGSSGGNESSQSNEAAGGTDLSNQDAFNAYRDAIKQRESSGDYSAVNQFGFAGAYQMGTDALIDAGYVDRKYAGQGNSMLNREDAWLGKMGVDSLDEFLENRNAQDAAFAEYTMSNLRSLRRQGKIDSNSSLGDLYGMLGQAHLLGAGGAGEGGSDANGTTGLDYDRLARRAVGAPSTTPRTMAGTQLADAGNMGAGGNPIIMQNNVGGSSSSTQVNNNSTQAAVIPSVWDVNAAFMTNNQAGALPIS